MLGFWWCQINAGSLAKGLCLSLWTKFFVWLFKFNICVLIIKPTVALISQIYFWNKNLHVSDRFSAHRQESSTVYTVIGICRTGYADCLLAGS
jgi:hypothetical protein